MAFGPYGSQSAPMPGQANVGYGPAGAAYDPTNPVAYTASGPRPLSVAMNRVVPHNAPSGAAPVSAATQWQMANPLPGSRLGREAAAREQALYGVDRYGGTPAGGGAAGGGGTGGTAGGIGGDPFSIATGINATIPQGTLNASVNSMLRSAGVPVPGAAIPNLARNYGDVTQALLSRDATDLSRQASFGLQDWLDQAERARANAGIGWGNVALQQQGLNIDEILGLGDLYGNSLNLLGNVLRN